MKDSTASEHSEAIHERRMKNISLHKSPPRKGKNPSTKPSWALIVVNLWLSDSRSKFSNCRKTVFLIFARGQGNSGTRDLPTVHNNEAPSKKSKKKQKSGKATFAMKTQPTVGFAERTWRTKLHSSKRSRTNGLGPTNVRQSILKKNGNRSPRAHLELKIPKTAERYINIQEQLGTLSGSYPSRGGPKHRGNPNGPTFADRDPKQHVLGRRWCKKKQFGNGPKKVVCLGQDKKITQIMLNESKKV